jgi:hypothetical protein
MNRTSNLKATIVKRYGDYAYLHTFAWISMKEPRSGILQLTQQQMCYSLAVTTWHY